MLHRCVFAVLALIAGAVIFIVSYHEYGEHRSIELANEHLGWGRLDEANEVLERAIERVPNSPRLRKQNSRVLEALGVWRDDPAAIARSTTELAVAASLNPLDGTAWGEYGESLRRAGLPGAAIAAIERGLTRDTNNIYLLGLLGQAQVDAGRLEDAVATFERAQGIRRTQPIEHLLAEARDRLDGTEGPR
jgi:tetratricopeptide (TPR) repeat protein